MSNYVGSNIYPTFTPVNAMENNNFIGTIPPERYQPEHPSDAFNLNNESHFPLGWFLLVLFLLIILAIIIFLYIRERQELINPILCPQIKGNYGVLPGVEGIVLKQCGKDNKQPCTTIQPSLEDAINLCDARSDICSVFSYDAGLGQMNILVPNTTLSPAGRIDVYTRQVRTTNN